MKLVTFLTYLVITLGTIGIIAGNVPKPTPTPYQPSKAELLATVDHISQLAKDAAAQLATEKQAHADTEKALEAATLQNATLQKQVNAQTDKLNSTQDKLDKAAKALWWYRLHWWGAWVMLGLGILACIIFAVLKFTGRLAIAAAPIAGKIP